VARHAALLQDRTNVLREISGRRWMSAVH
jgi:hypothetical protein